MPIFKIGQLYIDNDNISPTPLRVTKVDEIANLIYLKGEPTPFPLNTSPKGEYFTHPMLGNIYAWCEYC